MSNKVKEQDSQDRSKLAKSSIPNTKEKQTNNKFVSNNQDSSKQVNIKEVAPAPAALLQHDYGM